MSAPIVQSVGTSVSGVGDISVAWPVDHTTDDIGILFVESANQAVSTPSGWTLIDNDGTGTGGNTDATAIYAFWKRAASAAEANVTVADTGARQIGVIMVVRGCIASGSPIDVSDTSVQATVSASVSIPTVTTTVAETLVVNAMTDSLGTSIGTIRPASLSNAALQSLVRRLNTQSDGVGGGGSTSNILPVGMFDFGGGGDLGDVGEGPDLTTAQPCTAVHFTPNVSTIGGLITTADQQNILLILLPAGNKQSFTTTVGGVPTLDMAKFEANVKRFRPDADNTAFADRLLFADAVRRRRIILYVVDEPNLNNGTVANVPNISVSQANQMGLLVKSVWQGYDPLTLVRVPAETMASGWSGQPRPSGGWTGFDYCWSQYTIRHGRGTASFTQPWTTPVSPTDLYNQQKQIVADNNLDMGVAVSVNMWAGGIGLDHEDIPARWDVDGPGGSATLNWVAGNRDANEATVITTLPTSQQSLACNPNFLRRFAEEMAAIEDVPFCLFWQHNRVGAPSDEFLAYYQRADYQDAFADAIVAGLARTSFTGWRTAK